MKAKKIILCVLLIALLCLTTTCAFAEAELEEEIDDVSAIKQWIAEKINKDTIINFVNWLIDGGIGIGLISTIIKYGKEKRNTKEVVETVVKKLLDEKKEEEKQEILNNINQLKETNDTIVKALVMMQDSSASGKVALLNLLNVAKNTDVQKVVETTKQVIEEKMQEDNKVKALVENEYKDIF